MGNTNETNTNNHSIIRFNQEALLKSYIDRNIELRQKPKNNFLKGFFKLMNNSSSGEYTSLEHMFFVWFHTPMWTACYARSLAHIDIGCETIQEICLLEPVYVLLLIVFVLCKRKSMILVGLP